MSDMRKSHPNCIGCTKKSWKWLPALTEARFSLIFANFHWGAQNCWKSRKTKFYVFCLFTPLYRRFRLSRVSHAQDLDEIYRLVSKILNFMPCGSVFGRFCVFYCKNRFPKIKFAIEPCRREVLGRPVARYSAVFVFLSCARVLCAGLVRFSCAPSCAPKANYSTKHRN